jgi:hypothetical protein
MISRVSCRLNLLACGTRMFPMVPEQYSFASVEVSGIAVVVEVVLAGVVVEFVVVVGAVVDGMVKVGVGGGYVVVVGVG